MSAPLLNKKIRKKKFLFQWKHFFCGVREVLNFFDLNFPKSVHQVFCASYDFIIRPLQQVNRKFPFEIGIFFCLSEKFSSWIKKCPLVINVNEGGQNLLFGFLDKSTSKGCCEKTTYMDSDKNHFVNFWHPFLPYHVDFKFLSRFDEAKYRINSIQFIVGAFRLQSWLLHKW